MNLLSIKNNNPWCNKAQHLSPIASRMLFGYIQVMILDRNDAGTIGELSEILRRGGTAVIPCDTIYGLSSLYTFGEKALRDLKGRSDSKPFLVLATVDQAGELACDIPNEIIDAWPAPLTAVLKARKGGTIAVRVPDDAFLQALLAHLGCPFFSTSVNISGEPSLLDFNSIRERFEESVDVIVKGPDSQGTVPSTLIDATEKPFRILRNGAYDASALIEKQ